MNVYEKLVIVQTKLNAPRSKWNKFGGYYYRSCEDILEACKPLLKEVNASLFLSDEIVQISDRFYVKVTATFMDNEGGEYIKNTAYARESTEVKGMSAPQVTGASSTYARKYALNGLFCIDDTVDDDTEELKNEKDNRIKQEKKQTKQTEQQTKQTQQPTEPTKEVKEMLTDEAIANVDKNLIPNGGLVSQAQLKMLHAEFERTGIKESVVLSMFKVKKLEDMTDAQAIACLNKFKNTPTRKTE